MMLAARETRIPAVIRRSTNLFILEKGKPVARRRRKAMGPPRVARLPKG
jgi:hypothetical protein